MAIHHIDQDEIDAAVKSFDYINSIYDSMHSQLNSAKTSLESNEIWVGAACDAMLLRIKEDIASVEALKNAADALRAYCVEVKTEYIQEIERITREMATQASNIGAKTATVITTNRNTAASTPKATDKTAARTASSGNSVFNAVKDIGSKVFKTISKL